MSKQDVEHKVNYNKDGTIACEHWRLDDKYHRTDGPARIDYYDNGTIHYECWCLDGRYHRVDGPACIDYNDDGTIHFEEWRLDGKEYGKEEFTMSYQHQMYLANIEVDKMLEDV